MKFVVLASGSRGNITYIESKNTKILIDAGISFQAASKRADKLGIDLTKIDAILITHEHGDHINFLPTFLKKSNAIFYINEMSLKSINGNIKKRLKGYQAVLIDENYKYEIDDFMVKPLKLSHDSVNCYGFLIEANDKSLVYATDTGFMPVKYFPILEHSDAIIIESNHDIELLNGSNRSRFLKDRILSAQGHMSNHICGQVLRAVVNDNHQHIILAHLSSECNHEELALESAREFLEPKHHEKLKVAKQDEATKFIKL